MLRLREERRHLREPCGGVTTQDVENPIPAGTAADRRQRLQNRKVRLPGSVLLDALPAGDPKLVAGRGGGEEMDGQRRLADSRLSGEEHDLPPPRARRFEPRADRLELGAAPDEGRTGVAARPRRRDGRGYGFDRRHEPVAAAADRLDVTWRRRVVTEKLAHLPHASFHQRGAPVAVGPDGMHEVADRHEPPRIFREVPQDRESLRTDGELARPVPESPALGVETEGGEEDVAGRNGHVGLRSRASDADRS